MWFLTTRETRDIPGNSAKAILPNKKPQLTFRAKIIFIKN